MMTFTLDACPHCSIPRSVQTAPYATEYTYTLAGGSTTDNELWMLLTTGLPQWCTFIQFSY